MRYIRIKSIFLFLAVLFVLAGQSHTAEISGTITDSKTGEPIVGASVYVAKAGKWTVSDSDGFYEIRNVEFGSYILRISAKWYNTNEVYIDVTYDSIATPSNPTLTEANAMDKSNTINVNYWHLNSDSIDKHLEIPQMDSNNIFGPNSRIAYSTRIESIVNFKNSNSIIGTISETESGRVIRDASVYLEGTKYRVTSDEFGRFKIKNVPSGNYKLIVGKAKYDLHEWSYKIFQYLSISNLIVFKNSLLNLGVELGAHTLVAVTSHSGNSEFDNFKGIVLDSKTGEPMFGVSIAVVGTNLGAMTNIDGIFEIKKIPAGKHDVKISAVGYSSKTVRNLEVSRGRIHHYNFKMKTCENCDSRTPIQLPPIDK